VQGTTVQRIGWAAQIVASGLLLASAATVAVAVIPPARADPMTHPGAVYPFWLCVALSALAGLSVLAGHFDRSDGGGLPAFGGIAALLMGLWLLDGAHALSTHGPAAQAAVPALLAGAAADLMAAALTGVGTVLHRRCSSHERAAARGSHRGPRARHGRRRGGAWGPLPYPAHQCGPGDADRGWPSRRGRGRSSGNRRWA
jgi:hypothetical protein